MERHDLTKSQAQAIHDAIGPTLGYLFRLRQRMDKRGFSPSDPLYQLVVNAYDALHPLTVELHYLSCKEGVGRSQGQ
jgi:hypothetical protein